MSAALAVSTPMPVRLIETKLIQKGALIAAVSVGVGKMVLHDVTIFCSSAGRTWASPPSKPQIGAGGVVAKGAGGKVKYVPVVEWADRESANRFSQSVVAAFEAQHGPVAALAGGAR